MHSCARGPTRRWVLSTAAWLILGSACRDASGPVKPAPLVRTGSIRISVSMTGEDLQGAFTASVFNGSVSRSTAGSGSESVIVDSLPPGGYDLFLNLALNCAVDGDNPVSVTVSAGETTAVVLPVTCVLATATLHVTTVTTGVDLDRDGYRLRIDGHSVIGAPVQQISLISANDTTTLLRVPVIGTTRLTLYNLAINCDPADSAGRPVQISPGDTAAFTFAVACRPDTDSVAYVDSSAGVRHIVIGSANGGGRRRLTKDLSSGDDPAWSPDGKRVAFTTERDGNREIYVIDADGSNLRRLTNDGGADYSPAWSPDGTLIAFVSEREGKPAIYTLHADGTGLARLTTGSSIEVDPAWSPDGRIAFASDRNAVTAGRMDVYVTNADGSNPVRLTTGGGAQPAWSRDGRLAYTSPCYDEYCQQSILVRSGSGRDAPVTLDIGDRPSWSPDGRKIAYNAFGCGGVWDYSPCGPTQEVRIARVDGTETISLASGTRPAWRP